MINNVIKHIQPKLFILPLCMVALLAPSFLDRSMVSNTITFHNNIIESEINRHPEDTKVLEASLRVRKDLIKSEIKANGYISDKYLLSEDILSKIPDTLEPLVEKKKKITGDFERVEIDYVNGGGDSRFRLSYVEDGEKTRAQVFFQDNSQAIVGDTDSTIEGLYIEGYLLTTTAGLNYGDTLPALNPLNVLGDDNVLVIRANFQDNPADQPYSEASVQSALFSGETSTNSYFSETSYDKYSMSTGAITPWYTIPNNSTESCDTNYGIWSDNATQVAVAAGYNLSSYDRVMYLMAPTSGCGWAGIGTLPGDWSMYFNENDARVYTHEVGHNLGLHHASNYDCGADILGTYSSCTANEYGDYYDTMGYHWLVSQPQQFSGAFKASLGWIESAQIINATSTGRYTINYLEDASVSPQVLKVRKADTDEYYYFDYRKPVGFDTSLSVWGYTQTGAIGRVWSEDRYTKSYLVDFQPNPALTPANDFKNTTLLDGVPYVDSVNNLQVTQVSHDANTITLDVVITSHSILASAGANGSISPSGTSYYSLGENPAFTITPADGYVIDDVVVDGVSIGSVSNYTFTNISTNHTIEATFRLPIFSFFSPGYGNENMPATIGASKSFLVAPYDELSHYLTGYSGVTTLTSSDDTATLSTDSGTGWVTSGDLTYKYFVVTFRKTGNQTVTLTDTVTGRSTVYNFTVSPASLHHINISPNTSQTIIVGQNIQFTAQGQDQYNNDISGLEYTWTGTDTSGLFTGSTPGNYVVKASSGGIDSTTVNITVNSIAVPYTPPVVLQSVHRFWNTNGTHFYTASEAEKNNVMSKWSNIYKYEGIAYSVNASSQKQMVPLYRLWNNNGTHFYTASYTEAQDAVRKWPTVFRLEGVAYNVTMDTSGTPVHRFWNANGTHFYTASEGEKNNVVAKWGYQFKYEGVAYYLP